MSRNKNKGPYFQWNLIQNTNTNKIITIFNKNFTILPEYENFYFKIYNGKSFVVLKILDEMIGYRFGEFVNTRAKFIFKKSKKSKNIKKK